MPYSEGHTDLIRHTHTVQQSYAVRHAHASYGTTSETAVYTMRSTYTEYVTIYACMPGVDSIVGVIYSGGLYMYALLTANL